MTDGVEPPPVEEHDAFIAYIERHGYRERFAGRTYTYLDVDGHRYWVSRGVYEPRHPIINRQPIEAASVPSVWIRRRLTAKGKPRFIVEYRIGGRGRPILYGGSFRRATEATTRRNYIAGELAALRVPDLRFPADGPTTPTLGEAAEAWRASRIDVSEGTKLQHRSSIQLITAALGPGRRVDQISAADVSAAVTELAQTRKRETIRKALNALRMTLDHAGVEPNPCDKTVRLPFEDDPRNTRGLFMGDFPTTEQCTRYAVGHARAP